MIDGIITVWEAVKDNLLPFLLGSAVGWLIAKLLYKERLDSKDGIIASLKEQLDAKDGTIMSLKETYDNRIEHFKEQLDFVKEKLADAEKKSDNQQADFEKLKNELEPIKTGGKTNWPVVNNLIVNIEQQASEVRNANTVAASTVKDLSGFFADHDFVNNAFVAPDDANTSIAPSEPKKRNKAAIAPRKDSGHPQ